MTFYFCIVRKKMIPVYMNIISCKFYMVCKCHEEDYFSSNHCDIVVHANDWIKPLFLIKAVNTLVTDNQNKHDNIRVYKILKINIYNCI